MDSLTQIVLGAAVGQSLLGKQIGNKALLLGAIAGTIPDLDVILTTINKDPIYEIQTHRAYSHSMFTHILLALPLAWLSKKLSKSTVTFNRWYIFWFLGLFTHAILDCFTTYGTRLFLPFSSYQVGFNNVSVIDPLYTIPWLLLLVALLFFKRNSSWRKKLSTAGWVWSTTYMALTFVLKFNVHGNFSKTAKQQIPWHTSISSTPTILNAILWSGIANGKDSIAVAEFSFLNQKMPITWKAYPKNLNLEKPYLTKELAIVKKFANTSYFYTGNADTLKVYNIKWGRSNFDTYEPKQAFMFNYMFTHNKNGKLVYEMQTPKKQDLDVKKIFNSLLIRIGIKSN